MWSWEYLRTPHSPLLGGPNSQPWDSHWLKVSRANQLSQSAFEDLKEGSHSQLSSFSSNKKWSQAFRRSGCDGTGRWSKKHAVHLSYWYSFCEDIQKPVACHVSLAWKTIRMLIHIVQSCREIDLERHIKSGRKNLLLPLKLGWDCKVVFGSRSCPASHSILWSLPAEIHDRYRWIARSCLLKEHNDIGEDKAAELTRRNSCMLRKGYGHWAGPVYSLIFQRRKA